MQFVPREFLDEALDVEGLRMEPKWRGLEDGPVPQHILPGGRAHHRERLGFGFGMKMGNRKRHGCWVVSADLPSAGLCPGFSSNFCLSPIQVRSRSRGRGFTVNGTSRLN